MTKTEFSEQNKGFTESAHHAARKQFYPELFKNDTQITYENTDRGSSKIHNVLDRKLGIDLCLYVSNDELDQKIPLYIQERFRRPKYRRYQDLTITKFNNKSGEVSEVSKMAAQFMVYGYYDSTLSEIQEAVCVNVPILARNIADKNISTGQNQNDKKQDFITVGFDELDRIGALVIKINRVQSQDEPIEIDNREDITAWVQS